MVNIKKQTLHIVYIVIVILIAFILYQYFENSNKNKEIETLKQNNNESFVDEVVTPPPVLNPMQYNYIERTPKQLNALDRVYNPLRYPYKGRDFYNQNWRPNLALPPQVVGCGGRNTPCLGGSQVPIANPMYPLNINNNNIAPINIRTRGPLGEPQQVGSLYRLYSHHNEVLPLFGRKKYPNGSNNWEYYTVTGDYNVKMKIVQKRKGEEIGTNDIVFIKGYNKSPYRVTVYEDDFPQYIPYL